MAYDSPNAQIRREAPFGGVALASAGVISRFMTFQKGRLNALHIQVRVKGTADGASFTTRQGTTVLNTYTVGTGSIGLSTSIALSTTYASLQEFNVLNGADLTLQLAGVWEYSADWDATQSS
jgi:hypothetical protein